MSKNYILYMISLGFDNGNIVAAIQGENEDGFKVCTNLLKNQKFSWNPQAKQWEKPAVFYTNDLFDILSIGAKVYFPDIAKQAILNYPNTLPSALVVGPKIESIDYEKYMKENPDTPGFCFRPIKGKTPFENFQDEDIREALKQNRFLFNWEMGCGKSFATAVIYEYLKDKVNCQKMILFTTKIGTYNLRGELSKFCKSIEKEDVEVFNSAKSFKKYKTREIFDLEEINKKKILVFSYDSWKLVATAYGDKKLGRKLNIPIQNFFGDTEYLLCLDECHQLSNPGSGRSKSIFKYLRYFKYIYSFSATPADKNEKLYSVCMILDPKLVFFLKYNDWLTKYNDIGTWFSKYAINKKGWHMDEIAELNKKLSAYSAKRKAKDVLNLPECIFVDPYMIEMSDKQKELYRETVNDIVNNLIKKNPNMSSASVDIVKEAFGTVMSFVENPNVLGAGTNSNVSENIKAKCLKYNFQGDYAKLDVVDALLEDEVDEKGNRGIVWYIHPLTRDALVQRYTEAGYDPILISAEMSEEERFAKIEEFKKNPKHKIMIASEYILATSVTLIECTFAVYLETAFAYETYLQSTGRIYRIGQKHQVRIYHIYYEGTVDTFHISAIQNKQDLVNMLFSKEKPVFSLQQIRDIFRGEVK